MENKTQSIEELLTNQGFLKQLFVEDITGEDYNHLNLLNDLMDNVENIDLEQFELFRNGYVAQEIKTRLENINDIENLNLEIKKLALLASKLPMEISLDFFTSDEMLDSLLLLEFQNLHTIFKDSNPLLITLLSSLYLKKYKQEQVQTNLIKKEYNHLLDQIVFRRKKNIEENINLREESSKYSNLLKKQNKLETKCLDFATILNNLCVEKLKKDYVDEKQNENETKYHI